MNRYDAALDRALSKMGPIESLIMIVALVPETNRTPLLTAMSESDDPLARKVGLYFLARKPKQVKVLAV